MKSIILAAGKGERLLPITKNIPKSMVKLFGKSLLEWQIETLKNCNINDITIVKGYCEDKIKFSNIKYFENKNFATTNMVETLFIAEKEIAEEVIITYGDIIYEDSVIKNLQRSEEDISVVIDLGWKSYWEERFSEPLKDAESLVLDEKNWIKNLGQKVTNVEEIMGQYIGMIQVKNEGSNILKKYYKIFKDLSKNGKNPINPNIVFEKSYMTDFLQGLIDNGIKIKAIPIEHGWLELDTINDYELYNKWRKSNKISKFFKKI